jgi:hypothetical protein
MGFWQLVGAATGRCARGHKWSRWATKNGWRTRTCGRCGTTEQKLTLARPKAPANKRRRKA